MGADSCKVRANAVAAEVLVGDGGPSKRPEVLMEVAVSSCRKGWLGAAPDAGDSRLCRGRDCSASSLAPSTPQSILVISKTTKDKRFLCVIPAVREGVERWDPHPVHLWSSSS